MHKKFTDQLGNEMLVSYPPQRIISLVPSQTELLFDLGLEDEVVGFTKFCIHPQNQYRHKNKTKIGGTKDFKLAKIRALQPDLIIANKEENTKEGIAALQADYPVWVSDIRNLTDAYDMIHKVGLLVDKNAAATALLQTIQEAFATLQHLPNKKYRVAYFIWKKPYMVAASDTFIDEVLSICGWQNAFKAQKRYPIIDINDLAQHNVDLVLLSSEPYPFKQKDVKALQAQLGNSRVYLVDGEMFSWYGSRLLKAAVYLQHFINKVNENR